MNEELKHLIQLQEIDLRIKEQEMGQEQFPVAVSELKSGITRAEEAYNSAQERLNKAKAQFDEIDQQIKEAQSALEQSQERLSFIKTNREYDAIHSQIESQKNSVSNAEAKKANLTEEIEVLNAAVNETQQELETIKGENLPKIQELQSKIDAIDSVIAEITKEREEIEPKISKQVLRVYDNIRKKRKTGKALSLIAESKNCTVCFKILEPQLYNEIKKGHKIILCESCGSILIWDYREKE
ncbi:C4-type zinc ribbon domain-containing protein [Chitinispirillales bacterium ANBcel5]|uniref:zinc ribbon domain-containing protein n=1 Tax=Cellulosispirillum alkaliphilum TaxID=3039283 RepID=UPI002A51296E|nr:C4-type zinc ribbon domain-containing protein [Chitinispirillales bacterium ANBcel5]